MSLLSIARALLTGRRGDYTALAKLSLGYLMTALLPRRLDRWAVRWLLRARPGARERAIRRTEERMRQILGPHLPGVDLRALAEEHLVMSREIQWARMRAIHTSDVPLETSVQGLERIHQALERGNGAILWGMSFCETLPVKVSLARAGVRVVHLSMAGHGAPEPYTQLGFQLIGPLYSAPEVRFVGERVVIPADGSLGYMRLLLSRLAGNACVYVRGDIKANRNNELASVFGHDVRFAPGAPGLAWKTGAPLLPIHVVRDGPFRYRTVIHPPPGIDRGLEKRDFIRDTVRHLARLIERCALESPASWEISSSLWLEAWSAQ